MSEEEFNTFKHKRCLQRFLSRLLTEPACVAWSSRGARYQAPGDIEIFFGELQPAEGLICREIGVVHTQLPRHEVRRGARFLQSRLDA